MRIVVLLSLLIVNPRLFAQSDSAVEKNPDRWLMSTNTNLTVNQNAYSESWMGGEQSNFSWAVHLNAKAEKQFNPRVHNENTLKLAFGQTQIGEQDSSGEWHWSRPQKSTDLIDFESVLKFTLKTVIDPFVAGRLVSQFYDLRDPVNERYINPLEITESFGVARQLLKKEDVLTWNGRLGGAVRQYVDRDAWNTDLIPTQKKTEFTNDGGIELVTELTANNREKWWEFSTLLRVYEALLYSDSDEYRKLAGKDPDDNTEPDDWRYPDVNWENSLNINFTKYIMLNVYLQLIYDRDKQPDMYKNSPQLKETMSLGLTFNFKNH
ncbi:MAG: DUF3078 domain-containing protein [Chitinivibrionales bacterium]|nr:DUF3078 domain-containing protein [Chitinivibrionales bacterium]